jgi:SAM-dependent methyltransferase
MDKAKARARSYVNEHHPERATRIRDRIMEFRRLRSIEDRIGNLERAVHRGVSADQSIHDWETKIWSQNGEDGILLNLFSRIGATSRRFLEFGCGTGLECNSANLALGFGWSGLLLDANATHVRKARTFFDDHLGTHGDRVELRSAFVTPENINGLLDDATPPGEDLDLFSIDVDSIDYWIWDAVEDRFRPRVIVCEYNAAFGPTRSVTVTPREGFDPFAHHPSGFYHGASVSALHKLAVARGYQLIGCDSAGVNAFFVRRDCADALPDLDPAQAFQPNTWRTDPADPEEQFSLIQHLPLTEV